VTDRAPELLRMEDDGHEARVEARKMSAVDKAMQNGRTGSIF
jgi:hypothetical protein